MSDEDYRIRVKQILRRLAVSKSTFYRRVADETYPALLKDGDMSFYLASTLAALIQRGSE